MKSIDARAYGKVNLSLDITGKRADGYHEIDTVMHMMSVFDNMHLELVEKSPFSVSLSINTSEIPATGENLVVKAAYLMYDEFKGELCQCAESQPEPDQAAEHQAAEHHAAEHQATEHQAAEHQLAEQLATGEKLQQERVPCMSIRITLEKNLPISGGVAGGSADAAVTVLALAKLWNLDVDLERLCEVGLKLGADVPFMICGNAKLNPELGFGKDPLAGTCARAQGVGEKMEMLPAIRSLMVLAKAGKGMNTGLAYRMMDTIEVPRRPDVDAQVRAIRGQDLTAVRANMLNIFELCVLNEVPEAGRLKARMMELVGDGGTVLMSGSGTTVYALVDDEIIQAAALAGLCEFPGALACELL